MKALLKKVEEVYDGLQAKVGLVASKETDLDAREEKLDKKWYQVQELVKELDAREAAIKDIESAQSILTESKKIQYDTRVLAESLEKKRQEVGSVVSKIRDDRDVLERDNELRQKDWDLIKKAQAQLNEDRKNYKDEIINKLRAVK